MIPQKWFICSPLDGNSSITILCQKDTKSDARAKLGGPPWRYY